MRPGCSRNAHFLGRPYRLVIDALMRQTTGDSETMRELVDYATARDAVIALLCAFVIGLMLGLAVR